MSLPFPFDLYSEIDRACKNSYLTHIRHHQHVNYVDVGVLHEFQYLSMSPSDEMFASHLVAGVESALKALFLPVYDRTYAALRTKYHL